LEFITKILQEKLENNCWKLHLKKMLWYNYIVNKKLTCCLKIIYWF
jgi:hypothetical protein